MTSREAVLATDPDQLGEFLRYGERGVDATLSDAAEPDAVREPDADAVREPDADAVREPDADAVREPDADAVREPDADAVREPDAS